MVKINSGKIKFILLQDNKFVVLLATSEFIKSSEFIQIERSIEFSGVS